MTNFPSMPDEAGMADAMRLNAPVARVLIALHTLVMRGQSSLSEGEREFIAAFVSGLNACRYCHGVHHATAHAFGVPAELLEKVLNDSDASAAPERLRPLLRYARKLTLDQTRVQPSDSEAVLAAGWDERALHDAINVVALFNFMNRYVHGHGLSLSEEALAERGQLLMSKGYDRLLALLMDEETRTDAH